MFIINEIDAVVLRKRPARVLQFLCRGPLMSLRILVRPENDKVKMVDKRKILAQNGAFAQYGQSARSAGQRHRFQTALL